jgi:hypothetical protein
MLFSWLHLGTQHPMNEESTGHAARVAILKDAGYCCCLVFSGLYLVNLKSPQN